jgi:hypothetical protein
MGGVWRPVELMRGDNVPKFKNATRRAPDPPQEVALIDVEIDGGKWTLLADERSAVYRALMTSGVWIDDADPPKPERGK